MFKTMYNFYVHFREQCCSYETDVSEYLITVSAMFSPSKFGSSLWLLAAGGIKPLLQVFLLAVFLVYFGLPAVQRFKDVKVIKD